MHTMGICFLGRFAGTLSPSLSSYTYRDMLFEIKKKKNKEREGFLTSKKVLFLWVFVLSLSLFIFHSSLCIFSIFCK